MKIVKFVLMITLKRDNIVNFVMEDSTNGTKVNASKIATKANGYIQIIDVMTLVVQNQSLKTCGKKKKTVNVDVSVQVTKNGGKWMKKTITEMIGMKDICGS